MDLTKPPELFVVGTVGVISVVGVVGVVCVVCVVYPTEKLKTSWPSKSVQNH